MTLKLAGCIITNSEGGILLLHRNLSGCQQWEIPGGKIEAGEDAATAAIREVKEELNISVQIEKQLGQRDFSKGNMRMRYTWYQAKITSGEPKNMEPEKFDDMRYFSLDEMQDIALSAGAQTFLAMIEGNL